MLVALVAAGCGRGREAACTDAEPAACYREGVDLEALHDYDAAIAAYQRGCARTTRRSTMAGRSRSRRHVRRIAGAACSAPIFDPADARHAYLPRYQHGESRYDLYDVRW